MLNAELEKKRPIPEAAVEPVKPKVEVVEPPKPIQPVPKVEVVEPPELKAVPFNPYMAKKEEVKTEEPKAAKEEKKLMPHASVEVVEKKGPKKAQSHYDTVMRFAAVEFEGTIKN